MLKRLRSEESGAVIVITSICLVVLMAAVALTVDVGGLLLRRREMVNGADSAAHAAAVTYIETNDFSIAESAANEFFEDNAPGAVSSYELVDITWTGTPDKGSVQVTYRSIQPLYFAPVLGFDSSEDVATVAEASWDSKGVTTFPEVEIPLGYGTEPHDKVYVCKYVGKPGEGERLAGGQNPTLVNYNENWDGQTLFLDAQGFSVVIALKDTPGKGIEPEPECPEPGPHVWISN